MELTFSKQNNNVAELTLDQLKETAHEGDAGMAIPFNILMHYEFINRIMEISDKLNLKPEVKTLEAVNNRNKSMPGASYLRNLEQINGVNSHKNYLLRRIFADIVFKSMENDEYVSNASMIYHQGGVQLGFGTNVKACKNLLIMNADNIITFDRKNTDNIEEAFHATENILRKSEETFVNSIEFANKLKDTEVDYNMFRQLIGELSIRKSIMDMNNDITFLKDSHLGAISNKYLHNCYDQHSNQFTDTLSAWEIYNEGTNYQKPCFTDVPNIIKGNAKFTEIFQDAIEV